ncbi:nucleophile aminohydrolase [Kockovaella imperatae]|uniref:Proteasome subunit beta n=1 Tax=Kockovaella imperatae TaxID=4999 RepID=A0A1Y1UBY1_9TREE|nr:nucleophile aminohydrolase [Kockovaella imperatae]ORX34595.1 nucleophile aminohydrolase [Kockovaella imperatae]
MNQLHSFQAVPSTRNAFDAYSTLPEPPRPQSTHAPRAHTQQPIVTGTSVLGIKYEGGVMLAADNLASYGSLARFKDIQRLHPLGDNTCLAVAGDMSDFQYMTKLLDATLRADRSVSLTDTHPPFSPQNIYTYLSNLYYARRSKVNPLWNAILVGGWDKEKKESFLAYVDLLGTTYSAPTLATGIGAHIAQPLLREAYEAKAGVDGKGPLLTGQEAEELLDTCMKVLFYRDARSLNKYQIATISNDGVKISDSKSSETEWGFAEGLRGYGPQTQ